MANLIDWTKINIVKAGPLLYCDDSVAESEKLRKQIEPWLSALLQAEGLNVLIGSGFTTSVASSCKVNSQTMASSDLSTMGDLGDQLASSAKETAKAIGRGEPNIEDQIRSIRNFLDGVSFIKEVEGRGDIAKFSKVAVELKKKWSENLESILKGILSGILSCEKAIVGKISENTDEANAARNHLVSFLLSFASRAATRRRPHFFTTNYDRLIEYGCDLIGLRIIDRFVGMIRPTFRSSRLQVDVHFDPPGVRGEPRYLEGVIRLTKLHGSVDWSSERNSNGNIEIYRNGVPFGSDASHPNLPKSTLESLLIYPNPSKDIETLEFPYADLFRDFAAECCSPNSVLFTYGYGFGDDHINRIISDMLTIPSTHLVIISYDKASERIPRFVKNSGKESQISLLIGKDVSTLKALVENGFLPKPAIDRHTMKMVELVAKRTLKDTEETDEASQNE